MFPPVRDRSGSQDSTQSTPTSRDRSFTTSTDEITIRNPDERRATIGGVGRPGSTIIDKRKQIANELYQTEKTYHKALQDAVQVKKEKEKKEKERALFYYLLFILFYYLFYFYFLLWLFDFIFMLFCLKIDIFGSNSSQFINEFSNSKPKRYCSFILQHKVKKIQKQTKNKHK